MDKTERLITRRQLLSKGLALGAVGAVGAAIWTTGCGAKKKEVLSCNDTTGLAPGDVTLRTSLKYTDTTPDPTKQCSGCQLYKPGPANQCGGCQLFKGPVHPSGYCASWVQKAG